MGRTPPLNAVRVFVTAARLQSFKKAAAELFVTPGAVSRQIQALETSLGIRLFERKFREITLTQIGALYLSEVRPAVEAIDGASQRIRESGRRAAVRVEATPTFAMHWLIPRLAAFHAIHPDIEIRLTTSQGTLDPGKDVDLFIRRDPAQFGGLHGERFMTEFSSIVCSPRLPGWQDLRTPQAIVQCRLITMRSRPDLWPKWLALHGMQKTKIDYPIEFDNTILAIQAAIEGLGIACIPWLFLTPLLEGESLTTLADAQPFATGAYHFLQNRKTPSTASKKFMHWLFDGVSGA